MLYPYTTISLAAPFQIKVVFVSVIILRQTFEGKLNLKAYARNSCLLLLQRHYIATFIQACITYLLNAHLELCDTRVPDYTLL